MVYFVNSDFNKGGDLMLGGGDPLVFYFGHPIFMPAISSSSIHLTFRSSYILVILRLYHLSFWSLPHPTHLNTKLVRPYFPKKTATATHFITFKAHSLTLFTTNLHE